MAQHSLSTTGLSLSQAQSISNLCNQRSKTIASVLNMVNNVSKQLTVGSEVYTETTGNPMPANVMDLLKEKARLHAAQAFLMENIRAKDQLIHAEKDASFYYSDEVPAPQRPEQKHFEHIPLVDEQWGWNQLSANEYNEYLEAEAFASHIGQFIHKGGKLDQLREELPKLKTLEWIEIETGKKTPLKVSIHHNPAQLLQLHEELAALHRQYEQRVNYFKAMVKNLVTQENARIAKENAIGQEAVNHENSVAYEEYLKEHRIWSDAAKVATSKFEEARQKKIAEIAAMRIQVPARFQPVIDEFLPKLDPNK